MTFKRKGRGDGGILPILSTKALLATILQRKTMRFGKIKGLMQVIQIVKRRGMILMWLTTTCTIFKL